MQVQAGLSALEDAMKAGYEDFKVNDIHFFLLIHTVHLLSFFPFLLLQTIRSDPDLANLRASEEFEPLVKRFDESFVNENAINAIKSLFGIFKKE